MSGLLVFPSTAARQRISHKRAAGRALKEKYAKIMRAAFGDRARYKQGILSKIDVSTFEHVLPQGILPTLFRQASDIIELCAVEPLPSKLIEASDSRKNLRGLFEVLEAMVERDSYKGPKPPRHVRQRQETVRQQVSPLSKGEGPITETKVAFLREYAEQTINIRVWEDAVKGFLSPVDILFVMKMVELWQWVRSTPEVGEPDTNFTRYLIHGEGARKRKDIKASSVTSAIRSAVGKSSGKTQTYRAGITPPSTVVSEGERGALRDLFTNQLYSLIDNHSRDELMSLFTALGLGSSTEGLLVEAADAVLVNGGRFVPIAAEISAKHPLPADLPDSIKHSHVNGGISLNGGLIRMLTDQNIGRAPIYALVQSTVQQGGKEVAEILKGHAHSRHPYFYEEAVKLDLTPAQFVLALKIRDVYEHNSSSVLG